MQKLNFPSFPIKINKREEKDFVFDIIRKKYVLLTPEEWVRQHVVNFLIQYKGYARSLMKVESGHHYNTLQKRTDVLVYRSGENPEPLLLVECKSADQKLNEAVLRQVSVYNQQIKAPYLVATNGLEVYCWKVDFEEGSYYFLEDIPEAGEVL